MSPPQAGAVAARLHSALRTLHRTPPRLIASPLPSTKRASVAIIIRLRPENPPPSSSVSALSSPTTSPLGAYIPLAPSPPASPSQKPPSSPPASASTGASLLGTPPTVLQRLDGFFEQAWVKDDKTTVEILYIKRATRTSDRWSGHCAFPGGRTEPDDESSEFTAMRETFEEVGMDLAESDWISVGQLDDREITTSLGKRLLMILSPFVFLHTSPYAPIPELQPSEVASAHWVPLELLHPPAAKYGSVEIDIATRLAPRNKLARAALKVLMGRMAFQCILLPNDPVATGEALADLPPDTKPFDIKLWGLTLGMTLDLLSHMTLSPSSPDLSTYPYPYGAPSADSPPSTGTRSRSASSHAAFPTPEGSIFPRFSHPDINALIYLFSFRYRRLLRHPRSTAAKGGARGPHYGRVDWAGVQAGAFYAAVRKALVVAVLLRATAALGGLATLLWWVKGKLAARR
ncbi:hypothetical protein JCM10213_003578 [Rhodosporidiobolus nylandii]